jgi:hypothetical protein
LSDTSGETPSKRATPPYGNLRWYADFFDTCERIKVEKVDAQFIKSYAITPNGVEYKIINGLRFLGLINPDGTATESMKSLGVVGEAFQKNLGGIVRESYKDLFDTIKDFQNAKSDDIINFLRAEYNMAPSMADESARIFVFLAQKAGIALSQDIISRFGVSEGGKSSAKAQKKREEPKGKITKIKESYAEDRKPPEGKYIILPDDMIRIEYQNKVLMFLPKGNKQNRQAAAKLARQFIDTYEAEEGEE